MQMLYGIIIQLNNIIQEENTFSLQILDTFWCKSPFCKKAVSLFGLNIDPALSVPNF